MKRAIDVVSASVGLVLLSPLLTLIALAVKLSSPGPVLFRQQRLGRGMRPFWILKFRTMVADAEARGQQITAAGDERITAIGHWLRKTKLDELPQLINVLWGEMSLVGPRPEVPKFVELFHDDFEEILRVRPGMTDPASLYYRDEAAILARAADPQQAYVRQVLPEKIRLAKAYVRDRSLAGDLRIVGLTIGHLLLDRLRTAHTPSDTTSPATTSPDTMTADMKSLDAMSSDTTDHDTTDHDTTSPDTISLDDAQRHVVALDAQSAAARAPRAAALDVANVPFFRVAISEEEIDEVTACLRSGWLTTGQRVKQFEHDLAAFVGARHAVAVNSCTAALHLAVEALGLRPGQAVLVPTLTFAATAEVVRYQGAVPLLVDCDPATCNIDLDDARRKIDDLRLGNTPLDPSLQVVGVMPVHVAGAMVDMTAIRHFAREHTLWVVEDAAHALPAAYRENASAPWRRCGEDTAEVTCFSFYANKTITTGEGGMAVSAQEDLADRMRRMSLHGLSHDAWKRYSGGSWDYRIEAPGYKYNLTDIAAAIGIHQLRRAEALRIQREELASRYLAELADVAELELPTAPENRLHSWHLFPIRLRLEALGIDRNAFIDELRAAGIGCSVHWRPLHLHPYYERTFGWRSEHLPTASRVWERLISLPLFPDMRAAEQRRVIDCIRAICRAHQRRVASFPQRRAA